jgi:hypothetical protein
MSIVAKLFGNEKDLRDKYQKMIRILPQEFDLHKMEQLKDYAKDVLSKPAQLYEEQARLNPKRTTKMVAIENVCSIEPPQQMSYWETHP